MGTSTFELASKFVSWPIDWIIIAVLVALLTLLGFRSGSARTNAASLALPLSLLLYQWLPTSFGLTLLAPYISTPISQSLVFLVIFVCVFIIMYRLFYSYSYSTGSVLQALLGATAATIILLVVWIQVPAFESIWHFNDQIHLLFGEAYRLWWLLVAFLVMAFAAG